MKLSWMFLFVHVCVCVAHHCVYFFFCLFLHTHDMKCLGCLFMSVSIQYFSIVKKYCLYIFVNIIYFLRVHSYISEHLKFSLLGPNCPPEELPQFTLIPTEYDSFHSPMSSPIVSLSIFFFVT